MTTMSILSLAICLFLGSSTTNAFVVPTPSTSSSQTAVVSPNGRVGNARLSMAKEEEELDELVKKEIDTQSKMSKFTNEKGFQYAPWLGVKSPEDEAKIRQIVKEKEAVRQRRLDEEKETSGVLSSDSQAQELSGVGLKYKVIDGNMIELEWATSAEKFTEGFLVKRRPAGTKEFETIASYKDFPPLASKGPEGGVYRFLDDSGLEPGGYFYRVTECEVGGGGTNDLSQCLVELQTEEEQRGAVIAAVGVVAVLVLAAITGAVLDPVQS